MMGATSLPVVVVAMLAGVTAAAAADRPPAAAAAAAADPAPAAPPVPAAYRLAAGSTSPDGRLAIAFPAAPATDFRRARNLVVALQPFRILAAVAPPGMTAASDMLDLDAEWAADSSAVVVTTTHSKWDMIVSCSLVTVRPGARAGRIVDLLAAITRELEPDFRRSKAERFGGALAFILRNPEFAFDPDGKTLRVTLTAGNDPNRARQSHWAAAFAGAWNVATGDWQSRTITPAKE